MIIPGKIEQIGKDWAIVNFNGEKKKVNTKFVEVNKGDYVICAGDIIAEKIPKERAIEILKTIGALNGDKR